MRSRWIILLAVTLLAVKCDFPLDEVLSPIEITHSFDVYNNTSQDLILTYRTSYLSVGDTAENILIAPDQLKIIYSLNFMSNELDLPRESIEDPEIFKDIIDELELIMVVGDDSLMYSKNVLDTGNWQRSDNDPITFGDLLYTYSLNLQRTDFSF